MITWFNDYQGRVGKLIKVIIHQRADDMFDVEIEMIGGTARQMCGGSIQDAHDVAAILCEAELPNNEF